LRTIPDESVFIGYNTLVFFFADKILQYVPAAQESVIGVITQKLGEGFRVDIGSAYYALLDGLAFEGASKRNKPNLKVGIVNWPFCF
jgi:exosome complex RNA-binding protein Rrp4